VTVAYPGFLSKAQRLLVKDVPHVAAKESGLVKVEVTKEIQTEMQIRFKDRW